MDELERRPQPVRVSYRPGLIAWELHWGDVYGADDIRSLCLKAAFALVQRNGFEAASVLAEANRLLSKTDKCIIAARRDLV